jgi:hypothetical protein
VRAGVCLALLVAGLAGSTAFGVHAQGPAPPVVGVADDGAKYADDGGASIYSRLHDLGMRENRFVVYYDYTQPATIQEQGFLDRSVSRAVNAGIDVVFAVYPRYPRTFNSITDPDIPRFIAYLRLLARRYPQVTKFIVLNEPNEAYFQFPQYRGRTMVSARIAFAVLSGAYDALKSVNPGLTVIGLGLSPDGNRLTSPPPVRFLKALGDAYRRSGRQTPLMDELGFHVHTRDSTRFDDTTHFAWPNVGPADLDRVKQAVWDAFHDTGQPTFEETLRFKLAEIAVQVRVLPALASQYTDAENVTVTTEQRQAQVYPALLRLFACDPTVAEVMFFLLNDQQDLRRFQSGLLRIDGTQRPAYATVRSAIATLHACGAPHIWRHSTRVAGARAVFGEREVFPVRQPVFGVTVRAREEAWAAAGILRVGEDEQRPTHGACGRAIQLAKRGRLVAAGSIGPPTEKLIRVGFAPRFEIRPQRVMRRGLYVFCIRLQATMNPARVSTLVGPLFQVGF